MPVGQRTVFEEDEPRRGREMREMIEQALEESLLLGARTSLGEACEQAGDDHEASVGEEGQAVAVVAQLIPGYGPSIKDRSVELGHLSAAHLGAQPMQLLGSSEGIVSVKHIEHRLCLSAHEFDPVHWSLPGLAIADSWLQAFEQAWVGRDALLHCQT